jgi:hypothetical protein
MAKRVYTSASEKKVRIPLAGNAQQRSTDQDKDQRFVNYMIETSKNVVTETKKLFCVKRPGTVLHSSPSSAAVGRGVWFFNDAVWSIFGSTLYKGTTAKQTLSTATGICGATKFVNLNDFSNPGLFIADGIDAWVVDSTDAVTQVDTRYLQWAGSTINEVGDRRVATTVGTKWFVCTVAGTTGATEPTWPTVVGNTVVDGTVTWRYEGTYTGPQKRTNSTAYSIGDEIIPNTETGQWFVCTTAGTTAGAEPTFNVTGLGDTTTDGSVVWELTGNYGGFPTPHVASPSSLDEYIFLGESNSIDIYNSDLGFPFSWSALNFVGAESYSDPIVALARQNNFVVALGTESTEFMYNYAKNNQITDFTSPLDRYESLVLQVGCLNKDAIFQTERSLLFIAVSNLGGKAVWRLDGTTAKEISTEYIEKFLDLESNSTAVTGFGMRIAGHTLFIVNLPTANKSFVYDLEENMWVEWQYNGGDLPFVSFCDVDGVCVIQHATNGKLYKVDPLVYNDFDVDITARIRLAKQDFESDAYKYFSKIVVIGDASQHSDILRWSDDDYVTWSADKTLTAGARPYFLRAGISRRRAWELEYTHNSPRRLEALEINYIIGEH